jgi:hypothetical protein
MEKRDSQQYAQPRARAQRRRLPLLVRLRHLCSEMIITLREAVKQARFTRIFEYR